MSLVFRRQSVDEFAVGKRMRQNTDGAEKSAVFDHFAVAQKRYIYYRRPLGSHYDLWNGIISSDLEKPLTTPSHPFSKFCIAFYIFRTGEGTDCKFYV